MEQITTKKLKKLSSENANLLVLNVLDEKYYDQMHLPDSKCAPVDDVQFVQHVREMVDDDESTPIVVYCADESCPKSEFAAERLEAAGFDNVYDYVGGVKAWKNYELPLEGSKVPEDYPNGTSKSKENKSKSKKKASSESEAKSKAESKEKSKESKGAKESKSEEESGSDKKKQEKADKESALKIERTAAATWEGMLKDGAGQMTVGSAEGIEFPYSFAMRFGDEHGSNPEELLGAALAGCYSMALADEIGRAGYTPRRIESEAAVQMAKGDDGFKIGGIQLRVKADLSGIKKKDFQGLTEKVAKTCPVAKALSGVDIQVEAELTGIDAK